jgi:hypothetical protein
MFYSFFISLLLGLGLSDGQADYSNYSKFTTRGNNQEIMGGTGGWDTKNRNGGTGGWDTKNRNGGTGGWDTKN